MSSMKNMRPRELPRVEVVEKRELELHEEHEVRGFVQGRSGREVLELLGAF